MENRPIRSAIGEGAFFTHIADPKFKHNRLTVNFIMPLARETASEYALLPFLMRKGSKSCPDFTSLNARLYGLYGASLDAHVSKYNSYQILSLSIRGIADRYALEGEDVTGQLAALLCDLALEPNFDADGLFPEADMALERQFLIDTIEAEINEKRTYALQQCMAAMCGDEPVCVRRYGYAEDVRSLTARSAAEAWRRMAETARLEITFTGSGQSESAKALFATRLAALDRTPCDKGLVILRDRAETTRELSEEMDLHQSKLVMGMRCAGVESQQDMAAARVFSAMYGGTPFAKLFLNVRERLSLCYYCASHYDVSNRLLFVDSGVEKSNRDAARSEILAQLDAMRRGDFTAEELANTKLLMKNSIMSVRDTPSALETWYLTRALRGLDLTPEEDCAMVDLVTAGDVVRAAGGVTLDTVYFLTGREEEPDEA